MQYISKCEDWVINEYPDNEENCEYKLSDNYFYKLDEVKKEKGEGD